MATQPLFHLCHTIIRTTLCQRQDIHGPIFLTFTSNLLYFLSISSSQRPETHLYLNKCLLFTPRGRMHTTGALAYLSKRVQKGLIIGLEFGLFIWGGAKEAGVHSGRNAPCNQAQFYDGISQQISSIGRAAELSCNWERSSGYSYQLGFLVFCGSVSVHTLSVFRCDH